VVVVVVQVEQALILTLIQILMELVDQVELVVEGMVQVVEQEQLHKQAQLIQVVEVVVELLVINQVLLKLVALAVKESLL
jgi:hypothetical protein